MDLLPKTEAQQRLCSFQSWMRDASVDAAFVIQNVDLYYFSGTIQVGLLCLPVSGEPLFLVQKSLSRARSESPWERLVPLANIKKAPEIMAAEGIQNLRRIGLELDVLPTGTYLRLKALFPAAEFIDVSDAIRKTRMIKSAYEIAQMRRAAAMLVEGFKEIPAWMRPGATELEILVRLESTLRNLGHQGLIRMRGFNYEISFGAISIGPSACQPTFFPGPLGFRGLHAAVPGGGSDQKLAAGDTLMADIVGGYGGYIADKTRTFSLGDPPKDMEEGHNFVLAMMREIESMLRPATMCEHIWRFALERIQASPYEDGFMGLGDSQVRFLGHGVGLELDELPVLAHGINIPLEPGMTIAVEPKIFFPGRGGVGIENTYLITETGFENLTPFPESIIRA